MADSKHRKSKSSMWGGAFLQRPSVETIRRRVSRTVRQRDDDVSSVDQEKARQLVRELRVKRLEVEALESELEKRHDRMVRFVSQALALFDASASGFVKITLSDCILECNQSFADLCGKSREDLEGMELRSFIKGSDRSRYLEFLRNCSLDLHGDKDSRVELVFQPSADEMFSVRLYAVKMHIASETDDPEVWLCMDRVATGSADERRALATYDTSAFFYSAPEGFLMLDQEGVVQEWNDGAEAITGIASHVAVGKHFWNVRLQLVPESSRTPDTVGNFRTMTMDAIYRICEKGEPTFNLERLIWNASGACRVVNATMFPVRRNGHVLLGAIFRDVTESTLDDDDKHPSEIRYQALFNALKTAVLILDEGKVIECNHCACELFDLAEEELVHHEIASRFPGVQPTALESVEEWNRLERLSRDEHFQEFEWQFMKRDGSKQTALVQMHHLRIGQKSLTQIILRNMDDIIRTRFERDTLTAALDQTDEILILCDEDFQVQYVNATFEKNYSLDALQAVALPDLPLWFDASSLEKATSDVLREGSWSGEIKARNNKGETQHLELSIWPVRNNSGELAHYICLGRDRTREHDLETRLRQTQKMEAMGALAGGVAHDFNNMLQSILGFTGLAISAVDTESKASQSLNEVMKAGMRARDLVQQILTFSRQTEMERHNMRLYPLIAETVKMLRGTIPSNIEIISAVYKNTPPVMADTTQIHQVLMNLCTNAYHAMRPNGGVLTVGLSETKADSVLVARMPELVEGAPYVELSVSDTGCGISPEIVQRIFEPYFTTKKAGEGTGLGLSTVLGVVQSHQGAICVDSIPGSGTTFRVFFPLADAPDVEEELKHQTQDTDGESHGAERILIVDDEVAITRLCEASLEGLGYSVTVMNDPVRVLEVFKDRPEDFDLLITDQTMPGMQGLELATECMAIRPDLPVILCTGYSESVSEDKAMEAGVRHFVLKPFVMPELAKLIRETFSRA